MSVNFFVQRVQVRQLANGCPVCSQPSAVSTVGRCGEVVGECNKQFSMQLVSKLEQQVI